MISIPPHIRGLVFDCDGTIADTMPLHYRAWVTALGEHNVPFSETLFYELAGVTTVKIIEMLNKKHGYNMPVQETADRKDRLFEELIPHTKGIEPVVNLVHQYRGKMPMAVASGGTLVVVAKTLAALSLLDSFDAIVTADDVPNGKPAPDIFLESARRIGIPAQECCAFEDGDAGIVSARAAGMTVIDIRPIADEHRRRVI